VRVLILLIFACLSRAQTPTIRVPVRLVTAPTLVFSNDDHLVFGLEERQFHLYDNGRNQKTAVDTDYAPVSIAVAIQVTQNVRSYLRFTAKVGSAVDALLVGETGESAVLTYGDEIKVVKPFGGGDTQSAMQKLAPGGRHARAIDAGMQAVRLLKGRSQRRARVLLFIGQPVDDGSESSLAVLRDDAERENVSVYVLTLPEAGKDFVSDTFSLQGLSSPADRGGFKVGADMRRLVPVLARSSAAAAKTDPFSVLTGATGGTSFHVRTQRELEDGVGLIGVALRSAYVLSYAPTSREEGYHSIRVEVEVPGAKVYARPGYRMN
jgi:VWFA-related protein